MVIDHFKIDSSSVDPEFDVSKCIRQTAREPVWKSWMEVEAEEVWNVEKMASEEGWTVEKKESLGSQGHRTRREQ